MLKKSFFAKITGIRKDEDEIVEDQVEAGEALVDKPSGSVMSPNSVDQDQQEDVGDWVQKNFEGQLSVDVYQTKNEIIIKSAIAGVDPDDLDISISNDMITIRGTRKQEAEIDKEDYFYQECYWGSFSRSIILPQEVKSDSVSADFKRGILIIKLPKAAQVQKIKVKVN